MDDATGTALIRASNEMEDGGFYSWAKLVRMAVEESCDDIGALRARVAQMEPVVAAAIAFRDVDGLVESEEWADAAMGLSDAIDVYQAALRGEEAQGE